MRMNKIKNLSESELNRVFSKQIAPGICKRSALKMIAGGLSIEEIYQSLTYN